MITSNKNGTAVNPVTNISPELLGRWLDTNDAVLIDVREDYEHAEERINRAVLHPLSQFDPEAMQRECEGKRVVFHCRTGKRSAKAAARFKTGSEPVFHLAGGIEAWKEHGKPVVRPTSGGGFPIMRQVQIIAGALVAFGVGLGVTVSSWFLLAAGFVGLGLVFAGVSGWCGMARLLAVMPWNRRRANPPQLPRA